MSQRKRVEQLFDEACDDFARQIQEEVDKKLKNSMHPPETSASTA